MNETVIWLLLVCSALSSVLCLTLIWQLKLTMGKLFEYHNDTGKVLTKLDHTMENLASCTSNSVKTLDKLAELQNRTSWENKNDHTQFNKTFGDLTHRLDDIRSRLPASYTARRDYVDPLHGGGSHQPGGTGVAGGPPPYHP